MPAPPPILAIINILGSLTDGNVFLTLKKGSTFFDDCDLGNTKVNYFSGPHPSGNIGIQIHHLEPIANKDDRKSTERTSI